MLRLEISVTTRMIAVLRRWCVQTFGMCFLLLFLVPGIAASKDFPDLDKSLKAKDFGALYEMLQSTLVENSGSDGAMGWLRENLGKTDARFVAVLVDKISPYDKKEAIRWSYVTMAWAFQDAAECTDKTTFGKAIGLLRRMPPIRDYEQENPKEAAKAFDWAIDWVRQTPSPSDAIWICSSGIDVALKLGRKEKVHLKALVKSSEGKAARREKVLTDLRKMFVDHQKLLATAQASEGDGPPRTEFATIKTKDGFHIYETGLVTGRDPTVYFGPNNEVLFFAIDTADPPKGELAYKALSRKETTEQMSESEVAEAQNGKRLWDFYIWRPGIDIPRILYDGPWVELAGPYPDEIALQIGCELPMEGGSWCERQIQMTGLPDNPQRVSRTARWALDRGTPRFPDWVTERFSSHERKSYMRETGDLFVGFPAPVRWNLSIDYYAWYDHRIDSLVIPKLHRDGGEIRICRGFSKDWLSWMQAYRVSPCRFDDEGYFEKSLSVRNCSVFETTYAPGGKLELHCFDQFPDAKSLIFTYLTQRGLVSLYAKADNTRLLVFHPHTGGAYLLDHGNLSLPTVAPDGCVVVYGYSAATLGQSRTRSARATLRGINLCNEGQ
ncbi:MAG TPA: hypothetical protein DD390_17715 [Rhodospirillaceae bacterium]|nr:hypothetical protein [Rhodospirillaceae bacterium]